MLGRYWPVWPYIISILKGWMEIDFKITGLNSKTQNFKIALMLDYAAPK